MRLVLGFARMALNKTPSTFFFESVPIIRFLSVGIASEVMAWDKLVFFLRRADLCLFGSLAINDKQPIL